MDDFTQRFLDNIEKRSKTLGISNISKNPLSDSNSSSTDSKSSPAKKTSLVKSSPRRRSSDRKQTISSRSGGSQTLNVSRTSDQKVCIDAKENVDLALEINITTGPNVQVQVEVEEQEIDEDGEVINKTPSMRRQITATHDDQRTVSTSCIRDSSRNRLQRLGALYSNTENLSSPIHRTESNFDVEQRDGRQEAPRPKTRFNKLAELANSINTWEDDLVHNLHRENIAETEPVPTIPCCNKTPTKNVQKPILNRGDEKNGGESSSPKIIGKQLKWDKTVMDALESQGFKRRETKNSHLEFDFKSTGKTSPNKQSTKSQASTSASVPAIPSTSSQSQASTTRANIASRYQSQRNDSKPTETTAAQKKIEVSKGLVSGRAAIFENSERPYASHRNQKDPAEMSLKERMALFERNKGTALIPKAALGMAPSAKQISNKPEKKHEPVKPVITTPQQPIVGRIDSSVAPTKINNYNKSVMADSNASGSGIRQTVAALLAKPVTISEAQIAKDIRKARDHEMDILLNRFNRNNDTNEDVKSTPPPPPPPMPNFNIKSESKTNFKRRSDEKIDVSPRIRSSIEDMKRVKVNPPKSGQIYPALSDIESATDSEKLATETYTDDDNIDDRMHQYMYSSQDEYEESYMDSEDAESSANHLNEIESTNNSYTSTASSGEMDDYLDEALDDDENDEDNHRTRRHNKGSISSNSFCFEKKPMVCHQTIDEESEMNSNYSSPIKSKLVVNPSDDNNVVTLTHTVSFYRRQQSNSVNSTPVRRVVHQPESESNTDNDCESNDANQNPKEYLRAQKNYVDAKIKSLMDNVGIQQQQIAQASNALNTCASTPEFSGSTESVVAEWKLLVATHSRQAALNEVQRLRVECCLRPSDAPKERGRLTVKDITLPLKPDYVAKLSNDKISGHHLVCLLKYNEQVLATKTIPTLNGLHSVKFPDILKMDNVYADFKVTLEIYGMTAQRESLPHDVKYHIKTKKGGIKTPKGKKAESRLIMPPIQSPAGPNVVRSPSFVHYGFVIFSLRETQRTSWTLNQVSNVSPLVGNVYMKVNCALSVNIDYRGFLTMFEDISGFGAWHRRWCRLHGTVLSYWKYPDDERKPPIGTLDLSTCEQHKISIAPRDICARMNTMLLELKRPRQENDQDSLVLVTKGDYTIVRHLLSADTKEERNDWIVHFNKALTLMRAWGSQSR